ncbi:MAG: hypothetical protein JWP63_3503 [Candidatus Solibacter sp.]|jgi:hypothetical protein|nr:hypothetical protein [Candidatus Solibacter sp.]
MIFAEIDARGLGERAAEAEGKCRFRPGTSALIEVGFSLL